MHPALAARSVLITGAGGYLGRELLRLIRERGIEFGRLVAMDVRPVPEEFRVPNATCLEMDIRDPGLAETLKAHRIDSVVHLVAMVSPGRRDDREFLRSVEVDGTRNLLRACVAAGVRQVIVTSSGAAYGYHADQPDWIDEDVPLRGNPEFAYSDHKRQVEAMLAEYRGMQPELKQLILRPCTILGATTDNQITAMFQRRFVLGVSGASTPFVFVWDRDVAECLLLGVRENRDGIYNVAGSGTLTLREIARRLGKPCVELPAGLVREGLRIGKALGLSRYGPEQVNFLRYRPVLSNRRLIEEFGYTPQKTSAEAFEVYLAHHVGGNGRV